MLGDSDVVCLGEVGPRVTRDDPGGRGGEDSETQEGYSMGEKDPFKRRSTGPPTLRSSGPPRGDQYDGPGVSTRRGPTLETRDEGRLLWRDVCR